MPTPTPAPTVRTTPTPTPKPAKSMVWFWVILIILLLVLFYMWYSEKTNGDNPITKAVHKIEDALNIKHMPDRVAYDYE